MGLWFLVVCPNCRYSVESSAGKDEGFFGRVQTHICIDCEELVDVLIKPSNPKYSSEYLNRCRLCKSKQIYVWDTNLRLCPKCSSYMTISEEPTALWD